MTGSSFNPSKATGFLSGVFIALSREQGKLWQDSGKTTPAVADGDLIRVATCPFSGVDYSSTTDAARPTLKGSGSTWYLEHTVSVTNFTRTVALTQPYWAFASGVIPNSGSTLFDGQAASTGRFQRGTVPAEAYYFRASTPVAIGSAPADANLPIVGGAVFNGASSIGRIGTVEATGNAGALNVTSVSVGHAGNTLTVSATRIYGYCHGTGILSATQRADIASYLAELYE